MAQIDLAPLYQTAPSWAALQAAMDAYNTAEATYGHNSPEARTAAQAMAEPMRVCKEELGLF